MYSAEQENVIGINSIHYGNLQLRSGKKLSHPTIEEIIDEPIMKSAEENSITPTYIEPKNDPPSSVGASNIPQEEGGHPTELSKDPTLRDKQPSTEPQKHPTYKDRIKAPFLE